MTVVFRNCKAAFLWGFMALFLVFVAAMTYVLFRDGPPQGYSLVEAALIMSIFWMGGLGGFTFAASKACTTVIVSPGLVHVIHRFPFHCQDEELAQSQIGQAQVFETRDDEDHPYFHARIFIANGVAVDLLESHDRKACESVCTAFNQALLENRTSGVAA